MRRDLYELDSQQLVVAAILYFSLCLTLRSNTPLRIQLRCQFFEVTCVCRVNKPGNRFEVRLLRCQFLRQHADGP